MGFGDEKVDRLLWFVGGPRDIENSYGAVRLTQLHRFHDPAEAAASLALRDGRPEALGFYLDRQRIHVGDLATLTETSSRHGEPTTAVDWIRSCFQSPWKVMSSNSARSTAGRKTARPQERKSGPPAGAVKTRASDVGSTNFDRCNSSRRITERATGTERLDRIVLGSLSKVTRPRSSTAVAVTRMR